MRERRYLCVNPGLCGDVPPGVTLGRHPFCPANAWLGTMLGSTCPSISPSTSPSLAPTTLSPTATPEESYEGAQPLKDNWFRKRAVAREKAFPQVHSWLRKQAKKTGDS
mmetsp:Transcript_37275/g.70022  ORF Transcript_37275/g.70022 Transcript_37275/m.70022 type:complete len:109 (+) Transcript_37275:1959-2285(+)